MNKKTLMKIDVYKSSTYPFFLSYIVIQMAVLTYVKKLTVAEDEAPTLAT